MPLKTSDFHYFDCDFPECEALARYRRDLYLKCWSHVCLTCEGTGIVGWSENQSPLGSGRVWLESFQDLCSHCLGAGHCPRCGKDLPLDPDDEAAVERAQCAHCGWQATAIEGLTRIPSLPEEPCDCWERHLDGEPLRNFDSQDAAYRYYLLPVG